MRVLIRTCATRPLFHRAAVGGETGRGIFVRRALRFGLGALACACAVKAWAQASQDDPFASPAIDRSMFRDGEVRRIQGAFGEWRIVCDELSRLKQRFCNLLSQGRDGSAKVRAGLIVSTGDDGQPAAMLRLPLGVRLTKDIVVATIGPAQPAKRKHAQEKRPTRLRVVNCRPDGCMTLWKLTPEEISTLHQGGDLLMKYSLAPIEYGWLHALSPAADREIVVNISGVGFSDALLATQK